MNKRVEEEEIVAEEEASLESVDWDVDRMSEGTSSYDEEQTTTNSSESDSDEIDSRRFVLHFLLFHINNFFRELSFKKLDLLSIQIPVSDTFYYFEVGGSCN